MQILFSEREIQERVRELGRQISADHIGQELFLVGVLKGAFVFLADLVRSLSLPLTLDFMALSSYGAHTQTSGAVRILKDLEEDPAGKRVLLVEDIVDTGLTLRYLWGLLEARQPLSLKTCVFLDKPSRRKVPVKIDYCGFVVPDVFVVGYGLDYAEYGRSLPYLGILPEEAKNNPSLLKRSLR